MEYIQLNHPYDKNKIPNEPIVLILGYFDGVHLGHQAVIKRGVTLAKENGLKSVLMTFNHPAEIVYQPIMDEELFLLSPSSIKYEKIAELGVDCLYEVDFTYDFGSQSPQEFVDQYIVAWNTKYVVAGFDYTYGKKEVASMEHLSTYAKGRFEVVTVPEVLVNDEVISSTQIKKLIQEGSIHLANRLLGQSYETEGVVIHGKKRGGKELGYPTANIFSKPYTLLPKIGVYTVQVRIKGKWYGGMASIGNNITFGDNNPKTVEIYIFDFDETIYGETLRIRWQNYMRPEIKFADAFELIEQLKEDERVSRAWLKEIST